MSAQDPRAKPKKKLQGDTVYLIVLAILALLLALAVLDQAQADDFLDPGQAFVPKLAKNLDGRLQLALQIAPGYTLYKRSLHLSLDGAEQALNLPVAQLKPDPSSGEMLEVYHDRLGLSLQVPPQASRLSLEYQGCADSGLCYPPQKRYASLQGPGALQWQDLAADAAQAGPETSKTESKQSPAAEQDRIAQVLQGGNVLEVLLAFLLAGVLLSLTPCVLPMLPILSSIIVGAQATTKRRGLQLAGAYSLGMASVYTMLGVAAGLAGEGLAAFLQQPAVLIAFALLLALLALSMFDVYQLQMPAVVQERLSALSGRMGGGASGAAVAMGALSALMVGPCVAAPLAGALLFIGQTHKVWLGGLALFALAGGMSVPLLLTGASAGGLLPRAGAWMTRIKHVFGLLLLGVAWWMLTPLLGASLKLAGWGLLALAAAIFLGLGEALPSHAGPGQRALRVLLAALAIFGGLQLVGSASGAQDPLAPLAPLVARSSAGSQNANTQLTPQFASVSSLAELQRLSTASGKPVLLDFYADWCVACKEMERDSFADPAVVQSMAAFKLLRADITANTPQQRELLKRFGLFGPPGLVFLNPQGEELPTKRLVGYTPPQALQSHLQSLLQQLSAGL